MREVRAKSHSDSLALGSESAWTQENGDAGVNTQRGCTVPVMLRLRSRDEVRGRC